MCSHSPDTQMDAYPKALYGPKLFFVQINDLNTLHVHCINIFMTEANIYRYFRDTGQFLKLAY